MTCVCESVPHPAPAGVAVSVDDEVGDVPPLAVGSVVPVPVLTCCKQARSGRARMAVIGAIEKGTLRMTAMPA